MITLGLDPGLRNTGWGIVKIENSKLSYIDSGLIITDPKQDISKRIYHIYNHVNDVIKKFNPNNIAIEDIFVNKNPQTSMKLGYARGVLLLLSEIHHIKLNEYTPRYVKKAVVGTGTASKEQVAKMVSYLLPAIKKCKHDVTDALAIAICNSNINQKNIY